jgi:2-dehydro-3-deoxygalactonokinase
MDMMRGEEVETIALQQRLDVRGACWFILPGAHTKFVRLSRNGRIVQIVSTLTGEMMDALLHNTILAASVAPGGGMSAAWLRKGCRVSIEQGLSRAAYCVRLAQLWSESSNDDRASYLLGVLLGSDIIALKACGAIKDTIYVAGRDDLREAFAILLHDDGAFADVRPVDPSLLKDLAGWGALLAARRRGLVSEE